MEKPGFTESRKAARQSTWAKSMASNIDDRLISRLKRSQRRDLGLEIGNTAIALFPNRRRCDRIIGPVGAREFSPGQVRVSERSPGLAAKDICSPVGAARISQAGRNFRIGDHTPGTETLIAQVWPRIWNCAVYLLVIPVKPPLLFHRYFCPHTFSHPS
jgi:hypothetical protein